jgi:hypothetical protein
MQVFPEVTATWYIFLPLDFQGNRLLISQDEYNIVWTITDEKGGGIVIDLMIWLNHNVV